MNMKDVSVIIPVYNAEDYLRDCLLALIGQKNSVSVEYILVNMALLIIVSKYAKNLLISIVSLN